MSLIKANFVSGRTDSASGTGAFTMSSPDGSGAGTDGLGLLAAVTTADICYITMDPNRQYGDPEIIKINTHTAAATTADVQAGGRAQFGTVARNHPSGTKWVLGALVGVHDDGLIDTQTLAAPAATITFSSIPQTYRHLRLVLEGRLTTAASAALAVRFNGDTGANYDLSRISGASASVSHTGSAAITSGQVGILPNSGSPAGAALGGEVQVLNYAGTTFKKRANFQLLLPTESTGDTVYIGGFAWRSTAAITSITVLTTNGDTLAAGSHASLYGMR